MARRNGVLKRGRNLRDAAIIRRARRRPGWVRPTVRRGRTGQWGGGGASFSQVANVVRSVSWSAARRPGPGPGRQDPGRRLGQVTQQCLSPGPTDIEEIDQRAGIPVGVGTRVEEGPFSAPPLGDAHHLAVGQKHLSRAAAREADQIALGPGRRPTVVHGQSTGTVAIVVERITPPRTDPLCCHRHIRLPERVPAGNPRLYPEVVPWTQQDRSPAAPASHDGHASLVRPHGVDHVGALCAPEHQRRVLHLACHCVPVA